MKGANGRDVLLLILFFTVPGVTFGQLGYTLTQKGVDSLKALVQNATVHDSIVTQALADLSVYYRARDFDSSRYYGLTAIRMARKCHSWLKELNMLHNLATLNVKRSDFKTAYLYSTEAKKLAQLKGNKKGIAISTTQIGNIYRQIGNYPNALDNYLEALKNRTEGNDEEGIAISHSSIGSVYAYLKQYSKAKYHYRISLKGAEHLNNKVGVITNLNNLGEVFIDNKQLDSAEVCLQKALISSRIQKHRIAESSILSNLGKLYMERHQFEKASEFIAQGAKIDEEMENLDGLVLDHLLFAELFYSQKKYHDAIRENNESIKLANQIDNLEGILSAYNQLSKCYESLGEYKKAFSAVRSSAIWKDSLVSFEKFSKINSLETSYAIEKEQAKIEGLEKENLLKTEIASQRLEKIKYLILSAGLLTLSVGLLFVRYRQKSNWANALNEKKQIIESQNKEITDKNNVLESVNRELREKAFRAQINPHFVFNSLNSIQYLISEKQTEDAFQYLSKFSLLLRKTLDYSDKNRIGVQEEIEILALYLQLESLRFEEGFKYEIETEPNLQEKIAIPPMTIQPVVENAIVHGLLHKKGDRKLSIKFSERGKKVLCTVTDNGIGRERALMLKQKKGILFKSWGMKITEQRMAVQNTLMKENSSFIVKDLIDEEGNPSGTSVTLAFDNG